VNLYQAEIERTLIAHPDVADVAALGIPHTDLGERLIALVVPRDPACPPAPDVLTAFAARELARYKLPRQYRFVETLGRTEMGKLRKKDLAYLLANIEHEPRDGRA
jgi:acyl-CoA synthetase (AMP-forming)/AMP-acid ligase II